jgi:uncharacterized membrane protein YkgB
MKLIGRILHVFGAILGTVIFLVGLVFCLTFLSQRFGLFGSIIGLVLAPVTLIIVPLWAWISKDAWALPLLVYFGFVVSQTIRAVGHHLIEKSKG